MFQSHIHSEHPGSDPVSVRASATGAGTGTTTSFAAPLLTGAYAKWGITRNALMAVRPEDVSDPLELTQSGFVDFLGVYGQQQQPPIDPDLAAFAIEFFLYVLNTTASEESQQAGLFKLRDKASGGVARVSWSSLFSSAGEHYQKQSTLFTPRKLMRTFEELFWDMWLDPKITALDRVRSRGTKLSNEFLLPSGLPPKAYVVVPQLFTTHLTEEERRCRDLHMSTVEKIARSDQQPTYHGLDREGSHLAREANKSQIRNNFGVGHESRPVDGGAKFLEGLYGKGAKVYEKMAGGK